jgi:protein TonB
MLELKPLPPNTRQLRPAHAALKQQRLMVAALTLLLAALAFVLYLDRDFWFPDAQDAQDQLPQPSPTASSNATPALPDTAVARKVRPRTPERRRSIAEVISPPEPATPPEPITVSNRTVLPPLEVEVVAGDNHRLLHPGSNSTRVELQAQSPPSAEVAEGPADHASDSAARVTSNAAERVQVSADTDDVVAHSVRPGYPMLARQMKVEGSVILLALIGRDGLIQDLRVLSGPPILANAAEEAVRQWHFKPHYQGSEAVETQARITVNFTISTN